jgi:cytosine/adenosine deaminase-related metal-dependent hydrolase
MRKISADYIYPIASEPIKNGVITVDDDGVIIDVCKENQVSSPDSYRGKYQETSVEFYKGIICPGFINTHCHLELSHMRDQVSENLGMTGFIKDIITKRSTFSEEEIQQKIAEAEAEMIQNGIVAVGDISNNNSTFKQKSKGNLVYHTFIEVFDLNPDKAHEVFEKAINLKNQLRELSTLTPIAIGVELLTSIIPHAPYSVSGKLFELISAEAIKNNSILSIHNQESLGESELFISHSGPMFEAFSKMGIDMSRIPKTGVNSLRTTLPKLPASQKTLLVHNTYTSEADIEFAQAKYPILNTQYLFWCTCPNANMYIENKLPNYTDFINANARVTIGTDSLASNWSLSVLDELKTISKYYPQIPLQTLLTWATKNGADFLGFTQLGTIEKGKKPGLNLLKNVELGRITEKTEVMKLC